ncbi:MAG: DNA repair protein RecN [Calditrichota bacterium]
MLVRLAVKNFALLRDTEIQLKPGFSVVTGETGAGKSLLVEALAALGGARVSPEVVRDGARLAGVEGEFEMPLTGRTILRREISTDGRSRAFINESQVPLKQLSELAGKLFDITSQRAFSHLLDPARHLDFLDQFAGLLPQRAELQQFESDYLSLKRQIEKLTRLHEDFVKRRELLAFQLEQIEALNPQPQEDETLAVEIKRLEHYEDLHRDGERILELLRENDAAVDISLVETGRLLERIIRLDPTLADLAEELDNVRAVLREMAHRIESRCLKDVYEADRLEGLRERQHQLLGLARKFGGSYNAMLEMENQLKSELTKGDTSRTELKQLESTSADLIHRWGQLARQVGEVRRVSASELEERVVASLSHLGMTEAVFKVLLERREDENGLFIEDGIRYKLSGTGAESVEFFLSANPGLAPRPLEQVASGGELSRLLLALKETMPVLSGEATIILDEIDAGVSGKVSELVGRKLKQLAAHRQMIAITHLPQIAGLADHHLRVWKQYIGDSVETVIAEIVGSERSNEIAAMLSGGVVTDAARTQAEFLISNSESVSQS